MTASISQNIAATRHAAGFTQEGLASRVGVSRQTVSDWERGDSVPDLMNAAKIAEALGVTIDALMTFDSNGQSIAVPPKGKHIFGTVTLGERGQIVIPKQAREMFGLKPGDSLIILGDEEQGMAITKTETFLQGVDQLRALVDGMNAQDR